MNRKTRKFTLKSYNLTGQIATVVLLAIALIIVLFMIFSRGAAALHQGGLQKDHVFEFITLSVLAIGIPLTVFIAVFKTVILTESLEIDSVNGSMTVIEKNLLTGRSRENVRTESEGFSEFNAIRIKHDEDGIANHYHVFALFTGREPVKICTFSKYHYVLRFMYALQDHEDLSCSDLTEMDFETEKDFSEFVSNRS